MKKRLLAAAIAALLLNACETGTEAETVIKAETTRETAVYKLGDTGPGGGTIFYLSETGFTMTDTGEICHYLEAAPADIQGSKKWAKPIDSSGKFLDVTGTETAVGTGRKNTELETNADVIAAKACKEYSNNEKNDWFLPSRNELKLLYQSNAGVPGLKPNYYWSSSQGNKAYVDFAWLQNLGAGSQCLGSKSCPVSVRAIRAF